MKGERYHRQYSVVFTLQILIKKIPVRRKKMDDIGFSVLLRKVTEESDAYDFYENSRRDLDWGNFSLHEFVLHRSFGLSSYIPILCTPYKNLYICDNNLMVTDDSDIESLLQDYEADLSKTPESSKETKIWSAYNKIVSFHGNRLGSNMKRELQKLYLLLHSGGSAAVLFLLESSYFYFLHELYKHSVWGAYMKYKAEDIPSWLIWKQDKAKYYKRMLKDIGFSIVQFRTQCHFKTFSSDEECKDWIFSTIAFSVKLEEPMKIKFREEAFNIYLKYNKRLRNGSPSLYGNNLIALVKKPERSITRKSDICINEANGSFNSSEYQSFISEENNCSLLSEKDTYFSEIDKNSSDYRSFNSGENSSPLNEKNVFTEMDKNSSDYQSFNLVENNFSPLTEEETYFSELDKSSFLDSNLSNNSNFSEKKRLFKEIPVYPFLLASPIRLESPTTLFNKYFPNQHDELSTAKGIPEECKRQSQNLSDKTSHQPGIKSLLSRPSVRQRSYLTVRRIPHLTLIKPHLPSETLLNAPEGQHSHFSENRSSHLLVRQ